MLNRIIQVIEKENLSHASFADEIGVQRSSISHILNRRNNPSLDFVIKTLQRFTSINPEWLILGTGEMYKANQIDADSERPLVENEQQKDLFSVFSQEQAESEPVELAHVPIEEPVNEDVIKKSTEKHVSQVLIFYSDSTYGVYKPEK